MSITAPISRLRTALAVGNRLVLALAIIAPIGMAHLVAAPPATAHHTNCYWESRNPSPYGSYDKYASASKAMQFYVPVEGGGLRGTRVWFNPHVHGHAHSCLAWEANVSASTTAIPNGEWVLLRVQYWNYRTQRWVTAGDTWLNNQYRTQSLRWRLDYASPSSFTKGRVLAWWWKDGAYSNYRTLTCNLGVHGQSSYNCQ